MIAFLLFLLAILLVLIVILLLLLAGRPWDFESRITSLRVVLSRFAIASSAWTKSCGSASRTRFMGAGRLNESRGCGECICICSLAE